MANGKAPRKDGERESEGDPSTRSVSPSPASSTAYEDEGDRSIHKSPKLAPLTPDSSYLHDPGKGRAVTLKEAQGNVGDLVSSFLIVSCCERWLIGSRMRLRWLGVSSMAWSRLLCIGERTNDKPLLPIPSWIASSSQAHTHSLHDPI
jgi:hypothetical protein